VCDDTPRPLRDVNPAVPEWLEELVAKLQSKRPADRFASAAEVAAELSRHLAALQSGGVAPTLVREAGPGPRAASPGRRNVRRWGALALALAVVAGSAWVVWKNWPDGSKPADGGSPGVQPGPAGAPQDRPAPSLLLSGQDRVELANTAGMIDLNGEFTVEMWVKFGKEVQYFAGDEHWPGVAAVKRTSGWVLRIHPDPLNQQMSFRLNFTAAVKIDDRPMVEWAEERGKDPFVFDDRWHHLAISGGREGIDVFVDGQLYLHMKTANITFVNSPGNLFLGRTNNDSYRRVNCRFKAFRVSGKPLYSRPFTPPVEFAKTDDTLLLLDFSAGKGDKLPDLSGHGHHGTILGGRWSSEPAGQ
jgi:hypothetical protein